MDYQIEIKQIVDYPRCRIYRNFLRDLMEGISEQTEVLLSTFQIRTFVQSSKNQVYLNLYKGFILNVNLKNTERW